MKKRILFIAIALIALLFVVGCGTVGREPMKTVAYVDLDRFMGDWYVIAHIPTFIEKEAFNALESYRLSADGTVATTFSFNKGAFAGPRKVYTSVGFISDKATNAIWGMQFIWPFKSDYRVVYLAADYSTTIIGRSKRDYVWLMAREPQITEARYREYVAMIEALGYDVSLLRKVPQRHPS